MFRVHLDMVSSFGYNDYIYLNRANTDHSQLVQQPNDFKLKLLIHVFFMRQSEGSKHNFQKESAASICAVTVHVS